MLSASKFQISCTLYWFRLWQVLSDAGNVPSRLQAHILPIISMNHCGGLEAIRLGQCVSGSWALENWAILEEMGERGLACGRAATGSGPMLWCSPPSWVVIMGIQLQGHDHSAQRLPCCSDAEMHKTVVTASLHSSIFLKLG